MLDSEKIEFFKKMISPDTIEDDVVSTLLTTSQNVILNRMYPFGIPESIVNVPAQYETLQVEIAIELWNHRGAEGQTSHSENGISRGWESASVSSALLKRITPMVGSVLGR